jgi:dolichol kinase
MHERERKADFPSQCGLAKKVLEMKEDERQIFHMFLGACAILFVGLFGVQEAVYAVGAILIGGIILVHLKLSRCSLGPFEKPLERFERPGVTPGYGAMTLAAGALAILTLISSKEHILASLFILGFGDAGSTIFGTRSKRKLPYSRNKTFGGTAAFFLFSLPAVYFAGLPAIIVAAAAAIAESLESHIDDNLIIAVVCVIAFRLLSGAGF